MIFKYILTTNLYDDTSIIPYKNKIILSISSLWTLNLLSHTYINQFYFLFFVLSILSFISPIFWFNYKINSMYHKIDKFCVISLFIYIIQQNIYYHMYKLFKFISIILFFYILSIKSSINNNYQLQLYSHLIFRYFTFILLYSFVLIENTKNNNYLILVSFEYLLFNCYLLQKIYHINIIDNYLFNIIIIFLNEYYYYNYINIGNDKKLILSL
jgi:hypothetical protein